MNSSLMLPAHKQFTLFPLHSVQDDIITIALHSVQEDITISLYQAQNLVCQDYSKHTEKQPQWSVGYEV